MLPKARSGAETRAAMDRVNGDRSALYQHLRPATHSEPWHDYVGPFMALACRLTCQFQLLSVCYGQHPLSPKRQ
jgi:hypothetical protein